MTECERIIEQGILPKSFFKEEVKCGFLVTEKRKKIWAVLLDLLIKFDSVCKKYSLTYYLSDGTLLGAVRHEGFIPWDDDIDISMPRKDYEKFQELQREFDYPYFLQTPYTDPGYFYSFVKIRNTNTTGLSKAFQYQGFNDGICIDVFPLDVIPSDGGEIIYDSIRQLCKSNSAFMKLSNPTYCNEEKESIKLIASKNPIEVYEKIHKIATQYNHLNTGFISIWVSTIYSFQRKKWYLDDFKSIIYMKFEQNYYPVPIGWERILRIIYGNYMDLPSIEQRGIEHSNAIFDADISYLDYKM